MKFQGILCDNDVIYCLTGYNTTGVKCFLYAYTLKGEVFKRTNTRKGLGYRVGSKWEPEGMALYHPHPNIKCLLMEFVPKTNSSTDRKRIYSLGLGMACGLLMEINILLHWVIF